MVQEVERYHKPTRILHWIHAGAFIVLFLTGLLAIILLAIGVIVFVAVLAALVIAAIAFLVAIPYYFVAKPAQVSPGSYDLGQVKEK